MNSIKMDSVHTVDEIRLFQRMCTSCTIYSDFLWGVIVGPDAGCGVGMAERGWFGMLGLSLARDHPVSGISGVLLGWQGSPELRNSWCLYVKGPSSKTGP